MQNINTKTLLLTDMHMCLYIYTREGFPIEKGLHFETGGSKFAYNTVWLHNEQLLFLIKVSS